jgi:ATP-dependent Clp protease ATP-binding subunit ClpA
MSLDVADPALAPLLRRLGSRARELLEQTGRHALHLHADAVTPDHLLSTLMADEDCAAHAAVLHAFADPETIAEEARAISPGWMVVGSGSTLPFSTKAAAALASAGASTAKDGGGEVGLAVLLRESEALLDEDLRSALRTAGYVGPPSPASTPARSEGDPGKAGRFTSAAKRALSGANRMAASEKADSISPAHLFLASLLEDAAQAAAAGIGFPRARSVLAGRTRDSSAPVERMLPPDASLLRFLSDLPEGADSLALLLRFHAGPTPELAAILNRSKVNAAFLERAQGSFRDPE